MSVPEAVSIPPSSSAALPSESDADRLKVIEIDGENLYDIFADLWVKANCIYDVDSFSVLEGAGPCDLGIGPEFYEIPNYDTAVPAVFTRKGIEQLEQATIGSNAVTLIQKRDGKSISHGTLENRIFLSKCAGKYSLKGNH